MSLPKRIIVFALGLVVLGCSWSAWASFDVEVEMDPFGFMDQLPGMDVVKEKVFGGDPFEPSTVRIFLSGWSGSVTLYFFDAPNAVAVLAGVFMGLLALVPSKGRWPAVVALQLASYGSLHLGVLTVALAGEHDVWLTGWLTLAAFVLAVIVLVSGLRERMATRRRSVRAKAAHAARR